PTTTDNLSANLSFAPARPLQVTLGATASRFGEGTSTITASPSSSTATTTTYGATAGASFQGFRWVTARANYSFYYQEQTVGGNIPRNIVSLSLEIGYPIRVDR